MTVLYNIIVTACFFSISSQHYISPVDPCILAKTCKHTRISQCGQEIKDLKTRWFLDECNMFEYNCDHKKDYLQTEMKDCPTHTSQNPESVVLLTPTEKMAVQLTLTESTTHGLMKTQHTQNSIDATTLATPNETNGIALVSTLITSYETTPMSINIESSETTSMYKTTEQLTKNETAALSSTNAPSEPTTLSTYTNLAAKTILHASSNAPNGSILNNSTTTFSANESTETFSITASNETTLSLVTETIPFETTLLAPTSTAIPFVSTLPTSATENVIVSNIATNMSIALSEQITTVTPVNQTNITTAFSLSSISCGSYPKECNRPKTWETTVEGETRDFFQILKDRLGDRVQLLRGTTHWPSRRHHKLMDKSHSFLFDRHNESKN